MIKCMRSPDPLWRYGHSVSLGHREPPFWGKGRSQWSAMTPFERAMVVSYSLSIVTVALSVTIRPQFAIECLRRWNQQGVGHFGPKFPGVPIGVDPSCWGCKQRTETEQPWLTIIFEDFQPMWWQSTNVTDRRTDTDDMRLQYRALHYSASRGKKSNTFTR